MSIYLCSSSKSCSGSKDCVCETDSQETAASDKEPQEPAAKSNHTGGGKRQEVLVEQQ